MNHINDIQNKIKQLCADRYRFPGDFVEFSNKLLSLGVVRQTYDILQNDFAFYSEDTMLYHFYASEIDKAIDKNSFDVGGSLDLEVVKKAIERFDAKKLSVVEFHKEIARAGIVYVSVYLKQRKIYYLSQDAKYFLESY